MKKGGFRAQLARGKPKEQSETDDFSAKGVESAVLLSEDCL
jgi:hypothetical protein